MSLLLDIILVAVVVIVVIVCTKKGFFRSIMKFLVNIVSVLVAYAFTPLLSDYLYNKFLLASISGDLYTTLSSIPADVADFDLEKVYEGAPQFSSIIKNYNTTIDDLRSLLGGETTGSQAVSKISDYLARPVAETISSVIAFILIFLVAAIILTIICKLIQKITDLPVIHGSDRILGCIFGCACAIVFAAVYSYLVVELYHALGSLSPEKFGTDVIDKTVLVKLIYNHDIFSFLGNVIGVQ